MSSSSYKLILVVSDLNCNEIPTHIKEMLSTAKLNYVICLGNIGNKGNLNYLKSLSNNFISVYGDKDEVDENIKEVETVKIESFTIGVINGFQIVPWGDLYSLSSIRNKYGCDILLHGYTGMQSFQTLNGKHYLNPGSLSGNANRINPYITPGFMVLLIDNDYGICYKYELKENSKKMNISKSEFKKLPDEENESENKNVEED